MSMSTEPIRIRIFQPRDDTQNSSTTPPNSFIELKESSINSESFLQKLRLFLKDGELKNLRDPAAAEVADFLGEVHKIDLVDFLEQPLTSRLLVDYWRSVERQIIGQRQYDPCSMLPL